MRVEPWVEFYFYGVLLTSMCLFGISANTVTLFILNAFNEMRRQPINVYLTVLAIYDNGVLINALLMLGIPALVTKQNPNDYLPSIVFPSLDSSSSSPSSLSTPPTASSDSESLSDDFILFPPSQPLHSSSSASSFYIPKISSPPESSLSSAVNINHHLESLDFIENFDDLSPISSSPSPTDHRLISTSSASVSTSPLVVKSANEDDDDDEGDDVTFDFLSSDYLNVLLSTLDAHFNSSAVKNRSNEGHHVESSVSSISSVNFQQPVDDKKSSSPLLFDPSFSRQYDHLNNLPSSSSSSSLSDHHQHQKPHHPILLTLPIITEDATSTQPSLPLGPSYLFPNSPPSSPHLPPPTDEITDDPLPYYVTIVYPMALISQTGSIWTTCLITAERYAAICHPFRIRTFSNRNRAIWAVIFLSLGAFVYNIPRFIEIEVFTTPEGIQSVRKTALRQNRLYYWLYYICLNLALLHIIPLSLLTALNTEIYKAVRRASRNRSSLTNQEETELNIASMLVFLVSIFIACNAPAFVVNCMELLNAPGYELAVIFSNLLVCLNSSINFVIYCIFGKKFRKKLGQFFHCSKLVRNNRLANTNRLNNNINLDSVAITTTHLHNNNNNGNDNNNNNIAIVTNVDNNNSLYAINETYV